MTECCEPTQQNPKKHTCPENNHEYSKVLYATVLHHLKEPWKLSLKEQTYYFCDDPKCDVVYFSHDNSIILKNQLRTKVGVKESSDETLLCYCFGVSKHEFQTNKEVKTFITEKTKQGLCSCNTHNPSGKCCLKDFPA